MPCPTCSSTLQSVGEMVCGVRWFWCQRCGTLFRRRDDGHTETEAPSLVQRCKTFESEYVAGTWMSNAWRRVGIEEATRLPEERTS